MKLQAVERNVLESLRFVSVQSYFYEQEINLNFPFNSINPLVNDKDSLAKVLGSNASV